jgi:hypothetical protein
LGLIKQESIQGNAQSFNGIVSNTTMQDLVQHYLNKAGFSTLVEQFDYNSQFTQIIVPSLQTLSKTIEHLNSISVFYKTSYRFFIDFDTTYLISSSGNAVPKKGESMNSIMFNIGSVTDKASHIEGMTINKAQKMYYIPILISDCNVADDYATSQKYGSVTAITSSGSSTSTIDTLQGSNAVSSTLTVRLGNDNTHMIENISSKISNSATSVSLYKIGIDNAIFTPNKEYSIQFNDTYSDTHNGRYLLNSKEEIFIKDGSSFIGAVLLNLSKIRT